MKLIRIHSGTVAVRVPIDRPAPAVSPPLGDFIQAIAARYQFAIFPAPNIQPGMPLVFQTGRFVRDGAPNAFNQLIMEPIGDIVTVADTALAEIILNDLLEFLDRDFDAGLNKTEQRRSYLSQVIVEFEHDFSDRVSFLSEIEQALHSVGHKKYKLSKIGLQNEDLFAGASPVRPVAQTPLESIEQAEFGIERRVGELFKTNRYFCAAPLETAQHIELLEKIETLARPRRRLV